MLIREMSDIHLEFGGKFDIPPLPEDAETTLILAGDIHLGTKACPWIAELSQRFKHIIYVMGNHEYYGYDLGTNVFNCRQELLSFPNVHVLDDSKIILDGVRFLGSTLWTDFNKADPLFMILAKGAMSDYAYIKVLGNPVLPRHILGLHEKSKHFLRRSLKEPFDGPTVVVTHHGATFQSVHPNFTENRLNPAYYSSLEELMGVPSAWFFGHSHKTWHVEVKNTAVLNNPRGYYPSDLNPDFDPLFRIEVIKGDQ